MPVPTRCDICQAVVPLHPEELEGEDFALAEHRWSVHGLDGVTRCQELRFLRQARSAPVGGLGLGRTVAAFICALLLLPVVKAVLAFGLDMVRAIIAMPMAQAGR